ncbi:periplasmic heavy metal sensor [bacterium]|nr:periplasmic heavy metal sensor [bacterium]MCI0601974.1 periplasmic heavy metal sensor [bacterium]
MKWIQFLLLITFLIAPVLFAEEDPIARILFPPEIVMRHQQDIGLNESQQNAIKNEIQKAQSKFLDLQWQLQSEARTLAELLSNHPVDEGKILSQADKVMNLERDIKKTHLSLLVRIKNQLSEQQQAKLQQIRQTESK